MPLPAKFGWGGIPDIGTPLLGAIADEDAEFAKAEVGAGCVPKVGSPRLEAIEVEDVEFVDADADGGLFFVNDVDEPLACKNKLDLI